MGDEQITRAKFECQTVTIGSWDKVYKFVPVVGDSPENERFFGTTPGGELTMRVKNEQVVFVPGKKYYLDFSPAE